MELEALWSGRPNQTQLSVDRQVNRLQLQEDDVVGAQVVSADVRQGDDMDEAVGAVQNDGATRAKAFEVCSVSRAYISYLHLRSSALTEHAHAALETGMVV